MRKHARQNHPEWLKEQGQGCPTLYCTAVDASGLPPALDLSGAPMVASDPTPDSLRAPPSLSVSAAGSASVAPPEPSPADPSAAHLLMTAAESCLALSMAAHADADDGEDFSARADRLAAFMASQPVWPPPAFVAAAAPSGAHKPAGAGGAGGNKRPRSVRCGACEGCVRDDCGMCKNCIDKPKFGGTGQRKQGCVRKICRVPRTAP